jgi:hypothetical protein
MDLRKQRVINQFILQQPCPRPPSVPAYRLGRFQSHAAPGLPRGREHFSLFDRVKRTLRLSQSPTCNAGRLRSRVASLKASHAGAEAPISRPHPPTPRRAIGASLILVELVQAAPPAAMLTAMRRAFGPWPAAPRPRYRGSRGKPAPAHWRPGRRSRLASGRWWVTLK